MAVTVAEFINKVGFKVNQQDVSKVNNSIQSIKATATKLLGAIGIGFSLTAINSLIEEFGAANKAIKSSVGELENMSEVQDEILEKANAARLGYADMANYVANLTKAGTDIFPVDDAAQFTSTVAKLMKTAGRSDSLISSLMEGFNKSFQKGIVDTETLNKMLEQAPETANVLAKSLGVAKSQLLTMASDGQLTVQQLKEAFMDTSGEIDAAFQSTSLSISDAIKHVRNSWGNWLAQMNTATGITNGIARIIVQFSNKAVSALNKVRNAVVWLGDKLGGTEKIFRILAITVGSLAAVVAVQNFGKVLTFLKNVNNMLGLINAKNLRLVAGFLILALLVEDFINFMQGNDSLIGTLLQNAGVDVDKFRDNIVKIWENLKIIFGSIWTGIKDVAIPIFQGIWEFIKTVFKGIGTVIKAIAPGLADLIDQLANGNINTEGWEKVGQVIAAVVAGIMAAITAIKIFKGIMAAANAVTLLFSGPMGLVVVAIAALIAIVAYLIKNWDKIKDKFIEVWNKIKDVWGTVVDFFAGVWNGIVGIFSSVGEWFVGVFTAAWEGIKNVFSSVGSFFQGVWETIVSLFTTIGTAVGDAISGAVKGAINAVLRGAIGIINGFISAINFAIGIINKIPGVSINKIAKLDVPQLAEGGYVKANKPQPVIIGDNKSEGEIVSPISKMRETVLDALRAFARSAFPSIGARVLAGTTSNRSIIQNVNISNKFEGDRAGQQKSAAAMDKAAGDATTELARGLAYAR